MRSKPESEETSIVGGGIDSLQDGAMSPVDEFIESQVDKGKKKARGDMRALIMSKRAHVPKTGNANNESNVVIGEPKDGTIGKQKRLSGLRQVHLN